MSAYQELMDLYKEESILRSIRGVLSWDIETGKMPALGLRHRSLQLQYLSQKSNDFWTSSKLANLLPQINTDTIDNFVERRNVELIQRSFDTKTKLPNDLLPRLSSQSNTTNEVWKKAKHAMDFSIVKGEMEKLFNLNREHALRLAEIKNMNDPFDALIDERDEGLNSENIGKYFNEARDFLVPFIKKQAERFAYLDDVPKKIILDRPEQEELAFHIAKLFEYPVAGENARGNIDEIEHPQTIGCGPDDVRVTIKYGQFVRVIDATNHELGHAIHGLNKNPEWRYQPVNDFGSPSIGECNSRYTENKLGRSYEFYVYILPVINEISSYKFANVKLDEFHNCMRAVQPSNSRMAADEVTYGMHIIIRFELEKLLFNDQLSIAELPQAWNDKYSEYLGVDTPNDTVGVMQDLHWYNVWYGYFHGYFMGDLMGSQIHASMKKDIPKWGEDLVAGSLSSVIKWHAKKIYSQGALYAPLDLVKKVTGSELEVKHFKDYLKNKFKE